MESTDITSSNTPPVLDDAGSIRVDLPCVKCSYNLRGLAPEGVCPECGAGVGGTLDLHLLRFAPAAWVKNLASVPGAFMASFLMGIQAGALSFGHPVRGFIWELLSDFVLLSAIWLLTAPEPGEAPKGNIRRWVLLGFGILSLASTLWDGLVQWTKPPGWMDGLSGVLTLAVLLALIPAFFLILTQMSELAQRLPRPRLAPRARFLRWALTLSTVAVVGPVVVLVLAGVNLENPVMAPGLLLGLRIALGVAVAVLLAFSIWVLVFLFQFRKAMKVEAGIAGRIAGEQTARHTSASTHGGA